MTDSLSPSAPDQFDDDLDLLAELLAAEGVDAGAAHQIVPRAAGSPAPMSFSQELLWLLDRATPGMTAYNLPVSRRLRGALDVAALERALTTLAARHETLRTRLGEVDGEPRQLVDAPAPVTVRVVDVSASADPRSEAERAVREQARTPFDLAHDHLFRATLVRVAPDDHVLLLETHHIVVDGWSLGILLRELGTAYAGAPLPPQSIQYGDYAAWQRAHLSGPRLTELLDFWRGQLGEAAEPLDLPTDFRRPQTPTFSGARETLVLPAPESNALRAFAQGREATLYMLLLAAYATVLHRYTGRENVLVGSGSAGRTLPETEGLVGYLNNTLVQRADFAGDPTFGELLGRVRASALGAYDHQDVPLEKLVLELRQGDARLGLAPLFEVVLTMQDTIPSAVSLGDVAVESFGADMAATKFDITLLVAERDGQMVLTSQYRSDLFTPQTMRRFLGHVRAVLAAAVANPDVRVSAIPLLTDAERAELAAWNETTVDERTPATLVELFEAQAARVGSRAAVVAQGSVAGAQVLTYTELNARANQLAAHLRTLGVSRDVPVGLLLDRSADAVVGLLGILKSGGAYMPLSVDAPAARLAAQITESGAPAVVTSAALADRLPPNVAVVALDRDAAMLGGLSDETVSADFADFADSAALSAKSAQSADNPAEHLAYVLYTSGSTGTPKGVAVTHANAVHYARAISRVLADVPDGTAGDGLAALDGWQFGLASTLAADLGNTSLLPALLAGGTLHVLGKDVTTEPARFAEYVAAHQLDALKITPGHLRALTAGKQGDELAAVLPRKWVVTGGEALAIDFAQQLLAAGKCRVLNHYGPTETTVGVCTFEATRESLAAVAALGAQTVPVGKPLANTRAYVVDARGTEQPVGVPGELLLGGAGVARGYLERDDLTTERFVPFNGERVYRTGDRVRRLPNGTIEFLGRADDQVKVRGYRVELGEIEQVLRANPGVAQAVVVVRDEELLAYVVPKAVGYAVSHSDRPTADKLREWLAAQLPEYMVPNGVVLLDALPLTPNGKVDKRALPAPDASPDAADSFVEPRTETETQLAAIWQDVLKKERVGVTDSFLELGGHSLLAIRVLGRISKTFGVRLSLRTLFDAPTVEQLAATVDAERAKAAAAPTTSGGIGSISRDAHRIGRTNPAGPQKS